MNASREFRNSIFELIIKCQHIIASWHWKTALARGKEQYCGYHIRSRNEGGKYDTDVIELNKGGHANIVVLYRTLTQLEDSMLF